ncbi:MAG: cyclase family protein [Deltaproteobacteria bacterium]|nr:cyclase family protein [Deltaproteobacteria bacterium]
MIIDLSHTMVTGMTVYPGTPAPSFTPVNTVAADGFAEQACQFYSHVGTHVDAPAHIIPNGATIDQLPAERFIGPACLIDLTAHSGSIIGVADLEPFAAALRPSEFVLLRTGWDRFWGRDEYNRDYPAPSPEAARWLASFDLKGIGIDTLSVDQPGPTDLPIHNIFLSRQIVIVENLTNLGALPQTFIFSCLPLKIHQGDGSPVRAIGQIVSPKEKNRQKGQGTAGV